MEYAVQGPGVANSVNKNKSSSDEKIEYEGLGSK